MNKVTSRDGTTIAYDKKGDGLPIILVDGALCSRSSGPNGPLAELLQQYYTVYTYDRRGRGDSGDTQPYDMEREIEDISALIDEAGGVAYVYGISSGAALALEAVNQLPSITKLALYEAPFVIDDSRKPVPQDYLAQLERLLASDDRGAAVKYFMRKGVLVPAIVVAIMPLMPAWSKLKAIAHTLVYDTLLTIDQQRGTAYEVNRWSNVKVPTLVSYGGKSPAWMRNAMQSLAETLPNARLHVLAGQTHIVKPSALTPILKEFFAE